MIESLVLLAVLWLPAFLIGRRLGTSLGEWLTRDD